MKWQSLLVGFVVGVALGVGVMLLFNAPKYEISRTAGTTMAWILNTRTGEIHAIAMGKIARVDYYAKPPYSKPVRIEFVEGVGEEMTGEEFYKFVKDSPDLSE